MPAPTIDEDVKTIKTSLKDVGDQIKAHAEKVDKEITRTGEMQMETRVKVDQLLTDQGALMASLTAAQQQIAKLEEGGGAGRQKVKTLGELITESPDAKAFNPQMKGSFSVTVPRAAIDSNGSAGDLIQPQRVPGLIALPQQRLFVRDLLPIANTDSNAIEFVRETGFTNNANVVSENPADPKPESDIEFELDSEKVVTIAHWMRASKQVLRSASQLQGYINNRLLYGLRLREELQLLKGSGVGLNMNGLWTQASAYANPGVTVVGGITPLDYIRIMMLQVQLAEYEADGIVLNPINWTEIELLKTTDRAYLMANPRGELTNILWGRPVVPTKSLADNEVLVGAFQMGAQIWQAEAANITVSNQDRDNFVKNMVTILAEMDEALTVYRPEAFVKGTLPTPA